MSGVDANGDAGPSGSDSGSGDGGSGASTEDGGGASGATDAGPEGGTDAGQDGGAGNVGDSGVNGGVDSGGSDGGADSGNTSVVTTATFSMDQTCPDITNTATLAITLEGTTVSIQRTPTPGGTDQDQCTYAGSLSADCNGVTGTYSCSSGSGTWSATFVGQSTAGTCTLGTTWTEFEAFPGTSGCDATWTQEGGPPLEN